MHIVRLENDTDIEVTAYYIGDYETVPHPYEKHYLHHNIKVSPRKMLIQFSEGDYYVSTNQPAKRYLVETLEPTAPDGFFAWNFFDGILQQKEYFSDYVFEDVAADLLSQNPNLRGQLEARAKADTAFANNGNAQLDFVYRHSRFFEQSANRYPVFRLE